MFDKIILIDSYFPYQKGEAFLENEIRFLVDIAKDVYIFPIFASDIGSNRIPEEHKNIHCFINENKKIKKFFSLFNGMLMFDERKVKSFKEMKYFISCYANAEMNFNWINGILKDRIRKTDKVIFYSYWMCEQAYIAVKLSEIYGGKCISRCHGYDLYEDRAPDGHLPFRQFLFEHLDKIYPISINGENYLKNNYCCLNNKVRCSYLGTNDNGLNPQNKPKNVFSIVTCSNLVEIKRVDLLIKALAQIEDIDIQWLHFGTGELQDELVGLAESELHENIAWKFVGYVSNQNLMKIYSTEHFDLFVNVSSTEGIPVSIMEAMSFGIPTLATNVGGTSEIVTNGINGFLVEPNITYIDLANKIKEIIALDDVFVKTLKHNARKKWENSFDSNKNYTEFYKNLDEL